jgi:hypothetical protein
VTAMAFPRVLCPPHLFPPSTTTPSHLPWTLPLAAALPSVLPNRCPLPAHQHNPAATSLLDLNVTLPPHLLNVTPARLFLPPPMPTSSLLPVLLPPVLSSLLTPPVLPPLLPDSVSRHLLSCCLSHQHLLGSCISPVTSRASQPPSLRLTAQGHPPCTLCCPPPGLATAAIYSS